MNTFQTVPYSRLVFIHANSNSSKLQPIPKQLMEFGVENEAKLWREVMIMEIHKI